MYAQPNMFAAVIVTFHPDLETIEYINRIGTLCDLLVIVDNSAQKFDFSTLENNKNVKLIRNGNNLGLATALNQGVTTAGEAGFNHIFLFDQDTRASKTFFNEMLTFKERINDSQCVICAPDFIDINTETHARFAILSKWLWRNATCEQSDPEKPLYVHFAITSGSLLDYSKHLKIGPFRDDFFIDHIDSEYCIRASLQNYKIAINCYSQLQHKIGVRTVKKLFGVTIKPNNHLPVRRYYIARNGLYICRKYGWIWPSVIWLNFARLLHEIVSIVFFEENKTNKLYWLFIGVYDAIRSNMRVLEKNF